MTATRRLRWIALIALLSFTVMGVNSCPIGSPSLHFVSPLHNELALLDTIGVELAVGGFIDLDSLVLKVDGVAVPPEDLVFGPGSVSTDVAGLGEGTHVLRADAILDLFFFQFPRKARIFFELVDLESPDECEILNNSECLLPWPSSRFQQEVGSETVTGLRHNFPASGFAVVIGDPLDPAITNIYDGFSPAAQILMSFPQGVDLAASNAPVLLEPDCCGQSSATPLVDVRTQNGRSVEADSPTVLIDAETGERILHWVELDARAIGNPERQILFMRPGRHLKPGHRYIVAVRGLVDPSGDLVEAEPAFHALRDFHPTSIDALAARRLHFEEIFFTLFNKAGVKRRDLQLAFDFTVRSKQQLTERMLIMRDDALAYIDGIAADDTSGFVLKNVFNFDNTFDCSVPGTRIWRHVKGTFKGPYYLTASMSSATEIPFLNVDENRMPIRNGTQPFNFDIAVPCEVFDGGLGYPLLMGHGLFGTGASMVQGFTADNGLGGSDFPYIAGATDWRGLSAFDLLFLINKVIGTAALGNQLNNFHAFPNRLKQGQINALVLSHMMATGFFNRLDEFQRIPGDPSSGVFSTTPVDNFYFGVSLGGIMGLFNAAFNPHIERYNIDVGATNFALLLQRSTQFGVFELVFGGIGLTEPMEFSLGQSLLHELWVSAEPAPYARYITGLVDEPLPGSGAKKILMTVAWLDKQVSNQAAEIAARTLGLPSLNGSLQAGLQEMADVDDGVDNAYVVYDAGSFDVFDPAFDSVIPALANLIPSNKCDPHGTVRLSIPASQDQLAEFLQPGGKIFNFCDAACDAASAHERPGGKDPADLCDPLAP